MAVLAGIDEAGFGPILGPLVVSSTAFSLPRRLLKADLWKILRKSVARKRKHLGGRLLITDSKKAYSRSSGIKQLERTVMASLRCLDKSVPTLSELLGQLCCDCIGRLNEYPWYKDAADREISANQADIAIASSVFKSNLASNDMALLSLRSCCLDVAYYNQMVSNVKNKASVLFTATCGLIKHAFDSFGGDDVQIVIDRQGGRIHYRPVLRQMFSEMELTILQETPSLSSYEMQANGRKMRLHFAVGADERFLPVSLASMVSKYLRELLIYNINAYFAGFNPDLKPTAGYWKDGLRFIEEVKTSLPDVKLDTDQLIRCR